MARLQLCNATDRTNTQIDNTCQSDKDEIFHHPLSFLLGSQPSKKNIKNP